MFLYSSIFVLGDNDSGASFEEIEEGMLYNVKSSIFKWFQKIGESVRSIFVANVKSLEEERLPNRNYTIKRNQNILNSYNNTNEPPFNSTICAQSTLINENTTWTFCSCGDGVCASYEDKCNCPKDCGSCPGGTICKRGICLEFIPNVCNNKVCEDGENETCPWDCNIETLEVEETGEPQEKIKKTLPESVS